MANYSQLNLVQPQTYNGMQSFTSTRNRTGNGQYDLHDVSEFQLIDIARWKCYKCIFCLSTAVNPLVHTTSQVQRCAAIFCSKCLDESLYHEPHQICPLRCNANEELRYGVGSLPLFAESGKRSLYELYNLELVCKFAGCTEIVKYSSYQLHLNSCIFNSVFARICENCNVLADGHDCKNYIESLKKENLALQDELGKAQNEILVYRELINKTTSELQILKLKEAKRPKGMMNNSDFINEYAETSSIVLRFGNNIARFSGIEGDMEASELRRRIEDHFNTRLGSIIRVDYTILGAHQTLRQHGGVNSPSAWIAFPKNQLLTEGQLVAITIGNSFNIV